MIESLKKLIEIPSITGAKAEAGFPFGKEVGHALCYMLQLCDSFGFRTKNCDNYFGWAEIGEGIEMIGILCHLDVVPAGDGWKHDPFHGEIDDGKLYGRGSLDDKGPAMSAVFAMKDILDSNIKLSKRIRIIFGCQEETGNWIDMDYYKEHEEIPNYGFTPDADFPAIYGELGIALVNLCMDKKASGIQSISGGIIANAVADYAQAEINGQRFAASGKAAHGSTPWEGENAITGLMQKITESGMECKLAEFYMDRIGYHLHGEKIGLDISDEASGRLSFNVGKVFEEQDMVKLAVDIRFPVTYQLDEIISRLEDSIKPYAVSVELVTDMKPVYMEKDGFVIRKLMEAYREVTGDTAEASVMGGGTYARAMDNIVAFGPVFPGHPCTEHMRDEYIDIQDLEKARQIYRLALEKLMKD